MIRTKIKMGVLFVVMLCAALIMTACGGEGNADGNTGNNSNNQNQQNQQNQSNQPPEQDEMESVLAYEDGRIVQQDEGRLLITAYIEKGEESYVDATSFSVTDQTKITNASGEAVSIDELTVGTRVEAWHTGSVKESYPLQATAAKIVLLDDQAKSDTSISRSDAVRVALEAQTELAGPWAVKDAALDDNHEFWNIVIVHHQYMDQPVKIRIHAETGEIVPNVAAENEVFRVYTPHPDEEVGTTIPVEGEARVFEGVFSWTLEDGHSILDEGHVTAEQAAPEWGSFAFEANFETASQPNLMLVLYIHSAKDGSVQNELIIPLKVNEQLIEYPPQ